MSSPTQLKKKHKEDAALLAETRKSFSVLHVGNPSIHPSPVPGPGWYHIPRGMKNPVQALPWVGRSSRQEWKKIGHREWTNRASRAVRPAESHRKIGIIM